MAKKIHKIARYQVSVNELQQKMLQELMTEDAQVSVSDYFGILIVQLWKLRNGNKNTNNENTL